MLINDKQFYENLCDRELSDQEAFEAKSNFVGFFDLLLQIDKRINEKNSSNHLDNKRDKLV